MLRYFDHNATTPLAPAAREAWLKAADEKWMNPSSPYRHAAAVRVRLEAAREALAARFGTDGDRLVFTSGATESNNAVFAHVARCSPDGKVAVCATEHPSVVEAAEFHFDDRVVWLPVDPEGVVDLAALEEEIASGNLVLVSVMAANNETGVIQPWAEIASLCKNAEIAYHCDASQWVGKMPLEGLSGCSYVSGCGHKFGGPKGVGFLLVSSCDDPCLLQMGGSQESGRRGGTEDVPGCSPWKQRSRPLGRSQQLAGIPFSPSCRSKCLIFASWGQRWIAYGTRLRLSCPSFQVFAGFGRLSGRAFWCRRDPPAPRANRGLRMSWQRWALALLRPNVWSASVRVLKQRRRIGPISQRQ